MTPQTGTALRYPSRATTQVRKLEPHLALRWLEDRDVVEREAWVGEYRNSARTLGKVIRLVFAHREASWEVDTTSKANLVAGARASKGASGSTPPPAPKSQGKGSKSTDCNKKMPKVISKQLKDKTRLCSDYQYGRCKNPHNACRQGKHLCGAVLVGGRVCGGKHFGSRCSNPRCEY